MGFFDDVLTFVPARTPAEVSLRLGVLLGEPRKKSRGEKHLLVRLRDILGIDIPATATSAIFGERLATEMDVAWKPAEDIQLNVLTLQGLNKILFGATKLLAEGRLPRIVVQPPAQLAAPEWEDFAPARDKLEAVQRLSALTGSGPEYLGPGSKEHKRVLLNLSAKVFPTLDQSLSKSKLAESIANELGMHWSDEFVSTGETIRLDGLNVLLAGLERKLGSSGVELRPEDEAELLVSSLWRELGAGQTWDGRESVLWLADNQTGHANHTEWQGWYFEARGLQTLAAMFSQPAVDPRTTLFGKARFDFAHNYVWDMKAHTGERVPGARKSATVQTNDADAIEQCVDEQGLGFLVMTGRSYMDRDGSFKTWHDDFKGKPPKPSLSGNSRARKRAFEPLLIEAFWIPNTEALESGAMKRVKQGRQQSGHARRDKYNLNLRIARREGLVIASRSA